MPQAGRNALDRLAELAASGELAAAYPRVPALLAEVLEEDRHPGAPSLATAGRLLTHLAPDDVLALHPDTPRATVAVTGHATLGPLAAPLTAELARHGTLARLVMGDRGAYLRDLTTPDHGSELLAAAPDLTLCLLDAGAVLDALPTPWTVGDVADSCRRLDARLDAVVQAHAARGSGAGTLVLNTLPLPPTPARHLIDHRQRAELAVIWRKFNIRVLRRTATDPDVVVLDLDQLAAEAGPLADTRLAQYAGVPFTDALFAAYAREAAQLLRARRGPARKCLVLDLDHTLWSGALADDGPGRITATGLRGAPHGALQRTARQLAAQGVLLAVCSKNDPGPVRRVLSGDHPELALNQDDFACVVASWEPKDTGLRRIAEDLGLGVDALVFADDSPAERALVRHRLPEAAVVPLGDEPAEYVERLLRDGWFTVPRLTDDDRRRPERYRHAAERAALRRDSGSYDAYLRDLGQWVRIAPAAPHELARVAQLSLRTNQFNLTGERLGEGDLAAYAARAGHRVLAVRAGDRFGDSGLVGALLTRDAPDGLHVGAVLLSCRVLARGVEQGCLAALLADAARRGSPAVHARYRRTARNARAAGFYPDLGFTRTRTTGAGSPGSPAAEARFTHDLDELPPVPAHLTLDAHLGEDRGG